MGVIVTEEYTLGSGITINSYYASINQSAIVTRKVSNNYVTSCNFTLWVSNEARVAHKSSIGNKTIHVNTDTAPTGNMY